MSTTPPGLDDWPLFRAYVDMVRRTGATALQIRFSDDEQPVVWMALAEYDGGAQVAAALSPQTAIMRLAEAVVDGGQCTQCKKPTAITEDLSAQPMPNLVCWYQWDPELSTFRRSCEGE